MATQQADIGTTAATPPNPRAKPFYVELPGLWKAMILTSFVLNLVLIFVVLFLVMSLVTWRDQILGTSVSGLGFAKNNVAELRDVVQQLQKAHIITTIPLNQNLSLAGKGVAVPVDQVTDVVLTQPVPLTLAGADIDLGSGNRLHAQNISLELPAGTPLQIALKMNIPLDQVTIPIQLDVPVDIAMADTELAPQFRRLGSVVDRLVYPIRGVFGWDDMSEPDPPIVPEATPASP